MACHPFLKRKSFFVATLRSSVRQLRSVPVWVLRWRTLTRTPSLSQRSPESMQEEKSITGARAKLEANRRTGRLDSFAFTVMKKKLSLEDILKFRKYMIIYFTGEKLILVFVPRLIITGISKTVTVFIRLIGIMHTLTIVLEIKNPVPVRV